MERRASSENRVRVAALLLVSVACSAMLTASPLMAVAGAPLVFGATDTLAAPLLAARAGDRLGPSARVRLVSRVIAAAAWSVSLASLVPSRAGATTFASLRLPLVAIVLAIGTVVGAFGTGGEAAHDGKPARAPFAESPLIGLCDVATAAWCFVLAVAAHEGTPVARGSVVVGGLLAVLFRVLLVATVARRAAHAQASALLAGLGFVGWIGAAGVACTFAATPTTWSGLGAALVLTLAALLAELRRRRAVVVLLRGALAFAVATMLGVATLLSS